RQRAGAEGRAAVAFLDGGVVAVPVKLHAATRRLLPHGWEIAGADPFLLREVVHAEVEQDLGRVERVEAARTVRGRAIHERREALAQREESLAHHRYAE